MSRVVGDVVHGELGFRFAEPADLDGDGVAEIAGGARYIGKGYVVVFDTPTPQRWEGEWTNGLYGQDVIAVPDLNGDGTADLVISAPNAIVDGKLGGIVEARTAVGKLLWRTQGEFAGLGWQLDRAGDQDGDGIGDVWAGSPSDAQGGHVYLLGGRDGHVIRRIDNHEHDDAFGWYLMSIPDLDGDGLSDVAVGAPNAGQGGAVFLISSLGKVLHNIRGARPHGRFGEMLTALDDVDGDGTADLAVGVPGASDATGLGEVAIVSGKTGNVLHRLSQQQPGELYGRALATLDDLDGDGARDFAVAAPWYGTAEKPRMGRIEVRSARSLRVLAQIDGDTANDWLGWHMARAGAALSKPGILLGRLEAADGRGALELHEFR